MVMLMNPTVLTYPSTGEEFCQDCGCGCGGSVPIQHHQYYSYMEMGQQTFYPPQQQQQQQQQQGAQMMMPFHMSSQPYFFQSSPQQSGSCFNFKGNGKY
jgi:hypothetical protein